MQATIGTVTEGTEVYIGLSDDATYVVAPACENKNNGYWACWTHHDTFRNQLEKDSHIYSGTHNLMWVCLSHGPEVP